MPTRNIGINEKAAKRPKKLKQPGTLKTAGEILEYFKTHPVPRANPKLLEAMLSGRKRRPNQPP